MTVEYINITYVNKKKDTFPHDDYDDGKIYDHDNYHINQFRNLIHQIKWSKAMPEWI